MKIRKTTINDIESILQLYANARDFMCTNGNQNQWVNGYPAPAVIEQDIKHGKSYVCVKEDEILGTFYCAKEEDPTYKKIFEGSWLNDQPYAVVHRIASKQGTKGVASFCMNWCFAQCKNIKIDTHRDNIPMQKFLKKQGFTYCGIIYLEYGDERIAFQKDLMQCS